jgi:hypothetical protein
LSQGDCSASLVGLPERLPQIRSVAILAQVRHFYVVRCIGVL